MKPENLSIQKIEAIVVIFIAQQPLEMIISAIIHKDSHLRKRGIQERHMSGKNMIEETHHNHKSNPSIQ